MTKDKNLNEHEKINYAEYPAKNIAATKKFFTEVFSWSFSDYGPEYTAFSDEGVHGGFFKSDLASLTKNGGALLVFYSKTLKQTLSKVEKTGGLINKPVWSEKS